MRAVRFLPSAINDLDRIYLHYAQDRKVPIIAQTILDAIFSESENNITSTPEIGRNLSWREDRLRAYLTRYGHWVFYTYDDDLVYIHKVAHGRELQNFNL